MTEWDSEGAYYLTEGLVYIWWNPKLTDEGTKFRDPPILNKVFQKWMKSHPAAKYFPEPLVGPPMWKFPSAELRQEFKDTFLEAPERMEEIIAEGIAKKEAADSQEWFAQGKPQDEEGRCYVRRMIGGKQYDILIGRNPETGEYKI